ncbi:MAG TPA: glycosyltransferase family 2 protein [Stellaceae bacterium]|nr:glycosyltransferase family 2 protein [Stellaceae bacterium]
MKKPISITIFFPAYNEQENIEEAIEDNVRVAEDSPYIDDYEIILVNDGSTDGTQAVAEQIAARNNHVRVIAHERNHGYGAALRSGLSRVSKICLENCHWQDPTTSV